jgi:hypothetical protein
MTSMTTCIHIHNQSRHVYHHIAFQFCVYHQVCVNYIIHFVCKLHCIVFKVEMCKFIFLNRFLFMHLYKFQKVYKVVVTQYKDYNFFVYAYLQVYKIVSSFFICLCMFINCIAMYNSFIVTC